MHDFVSPNENPSHVDGGQSWEGNGQDMLEYCLGACY